MELLTHLFKYAARVLSTTVLGTIGSILIICAVWVIYDVWDKLRSMKTGLKIVWTVAVVFFSIITAVVYYFVAKR